MRGKLKGQSAITRQSILQRVTRVMLLYWSTNAEISDAESVSRGEFSKSEQNDVMSIERNFRYTIRFISRGCLKKFRRH